MNNPLKYVDLMGNEPTNSWFMTGSSQFRVGGYISNQFTAPSYAFSHGAGFDVGVLNKGRDIDLHVNYDFIASGDEPTSQVTHPIYGAYNVGGSANLGLLGLEALESFSLGGEHTSAHSQSLGTFPNVQLKEFPSITEKIIKTPGLNPNVAPGLIDDPYASSEKKVLYENSYFGQTDSAFLTYSGLNTEISGGLARTSGYAPVQSLLGMGTQNSVLIGGNKYSGAFARAHTDFGIGKIGVAGVFGNNNPIFVGGFNSKQVKIAGLVNCGFSVYGSSNGNCGVGMNLNVDIDKKEPLR